MASIAVIATHVTNHFIGIRVFSCLPVVLAAMDVYSLFAVPLFILISGCILGLKYKDSYSIKTFYQKRMQRILIPYLIWSLIYILLKSTGNKELYFSKIIFMILSGNSYYHLWFFVLIFQIYLIFPFYRKLIRGKGLWFIILTLSIQIIFNHLKINAVENMYLLMIFKKLFLSHIFYFSLGIWIADNLEKTKNFLSDIKGSSHLLLMSITFFISYIISFNWLAINNKLFETSPILTLVEKTTLPIIYIMISINLYFISSQIKWIKFKRAMETLSKYSFGIYLSHALILRVMIKILDLMNIHAENVLFYFISFSGTLILCLIFCHLFEKTVFSRYLLSIEHRGFNKP